MAGRHVDITRTVDDHYPAIWPEDVGRQYHRKPGPPLAPLGHRTFLDAWSGNPDTDRAWRD